MPHEDLLGHDPVEGTQPTVGELPPEPLESFPTRSLMDPMGEVAGYAALAQGAHRRGPRARAAVLVAMGLGLLAGIVVGVVVAVARLLG